MRNQRCPRNSSWLHEYPGCSLRLRDVSSAVSPAKSKSINWPWSVQQVSATIRLIAFFVIESMTMANIFYCFNDFWCFSMFCIECLYNLWSGHLRVELTLKNEENILSFEICSQSQLCTLHSFTTAPAISEPPAWFLSSHVVTYKKKRLWCKTISCCLKIPNWKVLLKIN